LTVGADASGDTMLGGFGADNIDGGDGDNVLLGDNGQLVYTIGKSNARQLITTTNPTLGYSDSITAGAGNDVIVGGTNSEMIDGHNVAGADGGDQIDGGIGNDVLAGDDARITRLIGVGSARFRVLSGGVLYNADGSPAVTSSSQNDPAGVKARQITLVDHSD